MFQFEGNNVWYFRICLSSPSSRVAQNQKMPTVTVRRTPMPKPAMVWLLGTSQIPLTQNGLGFGDLVGVDIALVSKNWLLSTLPFAKVEIF